MAHSSGVSEEHIIDGFSRTIHAYLDLRATSGADRAKALLMKNYQITLASMFVSEREKQNQGGSVVELPKRQTEESLNGKNAN